MKLEIVSHCWSYSRLLTYQLSSLVLFPPKQVDVTMSVFYSKEDESTCKVLEYFGGQNIPGITWNWRDMDKTYLFRRAIGRNMAGLETKADWVFYTDCDYVFREGCLDSISQADIADNAPLIFPRYVNTSDRVSHNDSLFQELEKGPRILDIDTEGFSPVLFNRAIGGVQIARGDVVRKIGYCRDVPKFMKPEQRYQRCREDVVFRKIIGSPGVPVDIPEIYRIEHKQKGRRWFNWWNKL